MNKTLLSLGFISTCLITNITYANPSLGNSAIKQHNEIIQKNPNSPAPSQTDANTNLPEAEGNRNTWGTAFDKHKKRVESEPSLRSSNDSNPSVTKNDHNNSGSLSNTAIKMNKETVNDNMK